MRIAVLGAGGWGTTLAILLNTNNHHVRLWSHRADHAQLMTETRENAPLLPGVSIPAAIDITNDLEYATAGSGMIVNAVPAQFVRNALHSLVRKDLGSVVFVNVSKGIEIGSLMTMSEVLRDVARSLPADNIATLSGPSFAEEVSRNVPTAVVAASASMATSRSVQQAFMTPWFRVYSSGDIRGVELGGSIKNVIAVGAGIADGAAFGDNTKAAIMVRATAEIARLGTRLGAEPRTFAGLSGIGDLIATCMSKHSRNRHVGEEIGRGKTLSAVLESMVMVAEGVATARSVYNLAKERHVEMPIVNEVYQVLFEGKNPIAATSDLMTRDAKDEI